MRIDQLTLKHFKGFESQDFSFHPEFNLLVGKNGTGKTSALDALAVAVGSWFLGIKGVGTRSIRPEEVMLRCFEHKQPDMQGDAVLASEWIQAFPCEIAAKGMVLGESVIWSRALNTEGGRTTYGAAQPIKGLASNADGAVRKGKEVSLPLISYYGTCRLCLEPRDAYGVTDPETMSDKKELSRLSGYTNSIDPRLSVKQLTRWIAHQSWIAFQQQGRELPIFAVAKAAMVACVDGASDLHFDAKQGEVVLTIDGTIQPFSNLSDGQRSMLAMIGDVAQKAARLNPHFGIEVLEQTEGVVMIDELDLHLHPRWQRRIIEDLRRTFPKIQFICTTHSPFLIQSIRQGQLIQLDPQDTESLEYENQSIEDIAEFVQGVEMPQSSQRALELDKAASRYYSLLQDPKSNPDELAEAEAAYKQIAKRYSANPGLAAILELEAMARSKED